MNKINSLESLRGIAAFIVALFHIPAFSFYHVEKGWIGVYFFFSLSGFVIALNYFDRLKDINSLIFFKKKRFLRLYPVHIFMLFVVLLIQIVKIFIIDVLDISYEQKAFEPKSWYTLVDFIQHIFLTQSVTNLGFHLSWNGAAWTISTEFYSYLIFGLVVIILRNNQMLFSIFVILYITFLSEINDFLKPYINFLLLDCLRYFFAGSLMYLIYRNVKFQINDFIFLILLLIIILLNNYLSNYFIFSLIILIVILQKKNNLILKLLNQKYLVYFGTISYSFYMVHFVVFYIFNQFLKILNINFYSGYSEYNFILDTFLTFAYLGICTIISILMFNFLENKFRYKAK